jgi:dihydroorotate dehydrogenase
VDKPPYNESLFDMALSRGLNVIAKIPPLNFHKTVEMAYSHGVRTFHATNTLPTPNGGMSGKALLPISLAAVRYLREQYPDVSIIGGGGISRPEDAAEYVATGANHVAIGTMLFNPFNWKWVKPIRDAAARGDDLMKILS